MKKWIVMTVVLSLALAGPVVAKTPKAGVKQSAAMTAKNKTFTINGKITKAAYAYLIKSQKPPERFAIMNPNPEVLDDFIKSGKTVTIEAVSVMGDNVNIQKIDGEVYMGTKEAKNKEK
jgi:hypothetical protein